MGDFFVSDEERLPVEVKSRNGAKATVYIQELSFNQLNRRLQMAVKSTSQGNRMQGGKNKREAADNGGMDFDIGAMRLYELQASIVDWTFTDPQGNKVALNQENISHLKGRVAEKVRKAIYELNEINESGEVEDEDDQSENPEGSESSEGGSHLSVVGGAGGSGENPTSDS